MSVRVALATGPSGEWDDFVRRQTGWTHFHLSGWRTVIGESFGHECLYFEARDEPSGALVAVLPLVRVKSALFGHFLVSMPFLNYGGPIGSTDGVRALADHASMLATRDRASLLELRSRSPLPLELPVAHRKITAVLTLPSGGPEALWRGLDSKVRSQVRRPQKEGVEVRFGTDQVAPFYDVFAQHMRDLGTPVLPRGFFDRIIASFGDDVRVGCAYLGDRAIAAGFGLCWADEIEMTWASSLREFGRIAPNMLLYWSFLERASLEGIRTFNFGRCTPGGGTHRFKRQWGASDEPLWWYGRSPSGRLTATPSPNDGAYAWGPRLLRHLPMPIANAVGPHIVRYIP